MAGNDPFATAASPPLNTGNVSAPYNGTAYPAQQQAAGYGQTNSQEGLSSASIRGRFPVWADFHVEAAFHSLVDYQGAFGFLIAQKSESN